MRFARSVLFVVWLWVAMLVIGGLGAPLAMASRRLALLVARTWVRVGFFGLRWIGGVRVKIEGLEHVPTGAGLVAAKHQSMLDTLIPLIALRAPAIGLKRELLDEPVFGWYTRWTGMMPIDREANAAALKALVRDARAVAAEGRQVFLFPEGTRLPPGAATSYKPGVAALYKDLELPCTPLAHNSGYHWPTKGFVLTPGEVIFRFLPPIPAGLDRKTFMAELERRIETESAAIAAAQLAR